MNETGSELRGWTRRNFLKLPASRDARCFSPGWHTPPNLMS